MGAVRRAPGEGEIAALERLAATPMVGELRGQRAVGAIVLRHHHETGRVLVEPVHDPGPPLAADPRKAVAAMRNQRIDQRSGPVAGRGMNDEIAGFVDDDDVLVLVNDVERDGLGRRLGRLGRRNVEPDGGAAIDAVVRIADRLPVDRNGAGLDQDFEPGPRQSGDMAGKHAVEPLAGFLGGDEDRSLRGWSERHE